jgi:hypothetical protein
MGGGFRTLARVEPARVSVTVDGCARVRVVGRVHGYVRCAGESRWCWGAFDETFLVHEARAAIAVQAWGLFGRASAEVHCEGVADLKSPVFPLASVHAQLRRGAQPSGRLIGVVRSARRAWPRYLTPSVSPLSRETIERLTSQNAEKD